MVMWQWILETERIQQNLMLQHAAAFAQHSGHFAAHSINLNQMHIM